MKIYKIIIVALISIISVTAFAVPVTEDSFSNDAYVSEDLSDIPGILNTTCGAYSMNCSNIWSTGTLDFLTPINAFGFTVDRAKTSTFSVYVFDDSENLIDSYIWHSGISFVGLAEDFAIIDKVVIETNDDIFLNHLVFEHRNEQEVPEPLAIYLLFFASTFLIFFRKAKI